MEEGNLRFAATACCKSVAPTPRPAASRLRGLRLHASTLLPRPHPQHNHTRFLVCAPPCPVLLPHHSLPPDSPAQFHHLSIATPHNISVPPLRLVSVQPAAPCSSTDRPTLEANCRLWTTPVPATLRYCSVSFRSLATARLLCALQPLLVDLTVCTCSRRSCSLVPPRADRHGPARP